MPRGVQQIDLETLVAVIARSAIVVASRSVRAPLPGNFDEVDIAILDWIAQEGRRASRGIRLM